MKIDVVAVGNHEFDYGSEVLRQRVKQSSFVWLGANVVEKVSGKLFEGLVAHHIFERAGLKIGVFGVCTQTTPSLSYPGDGVLFSDPIEASRAAVAELKAAGADLIVAITHVRLELDQKIASEVGGIDIILGGHDHEPVASLHDDSLLFKCGQNAYWVGSVDIDFVVAPDGDLKRFLSWSMHSTHAVAPDVEVARVVKHYRNASDRAQEHLHDLDEELCTLVGPVRLDTRTRFVRTRESSGPNMVADALLHFYAEQTGANPSFAIINGGFIRADRLYEREGVLSRRCILEEMPFPKRSCLIEISGEHLWTAIEQQLRLYPAPSGAFPHFSAGVSLRFSGSQTPLQRLVSVSIGGQSLQPHRRYRVATSEFIAAGGDGCNAFSYGVTIDGLRHQRIALIVADYLGKRDSFRPELAQRTLDVDENDKDSAR